MSAPTQPSGVTNESSKLVEAQSYYNQGDWIRACCPRCGCCVSVLADRRVQTGFINQLCRYCNEVFKAPMFRLPRHAPTLFVGCTVTDGKRLMIYHEACNITTFLELKPSVLPGPYSVPCACGRNATGTLMRHPHNGVWMAHYNKDAPWQFTNHPNVLANDPNAPSFVSKRPEHMPTLTKVTISCDNATCQAANILHKPSGWSGHLRFICHKCRSSNHAHHVWNAVGYHDSPNNLLLAAKL